MLLNTTQLNYHTDIGQASPAGVGVGWEGKTYERLARNVRNDRFGKAVSGIVHITRDVTTRYAQPTGTTEPITAVLQHYTATDSRPLTPMPPSNRIICSWSAAACAECGEIPGVPTDAIQRLQKSGR